MTAGRPALPLTLLLPAIAAAEVNAQTTASVDRHGWDVARDPVAWRTHQRERMAQEYSEDDW